MVLESQNRLDTSANLFPKRLRECRLLAPSCRKDGSTQPLMDSFRFRVAMGWLRLPLLRIKYSCKIKLATASGFFLLSEPLSLETFSGIFDYAASAFFLPSFL